MTAYRKPADIVPLEPEKVLVGLIRANGSACECVPPSEWWCRRRYVQEGDRWYCAHGGGWVRKRANHGESVRWHEEAKL